VTFWEEGTLSKADLRDIAASRLAGATDRASCLLVDNRINNVMEWRGAVAWLGAFRAVRHRPRAWAN